MKRYRFIAGSLLSLLGLAIVIAMGIRKPPINVPYAQWKARIGPVHIGWMIGIGICVLGLILILQDTFTRDRQIESAEREEQLLRQEILDLLPEAKINQQGLNQFIVERHGRSGLIGLNLEQLKSVRNYLGHKVAKRD